MPVVEILGEIPDPRRYNAQHDLTDILFVAFAAMLCGATHCTEMAVFAEARLALLRQIIPLKDGAPSHDTFSRVFRALDPAAFNVAFQRLMAAFGLQARQDSAGQLAIDGKSLRRAYEKGRAHMPPLVVTVFDCESFLSLAQAVAGAGGEAEAAIEALKLLSLDGRLVSGDALHCHRRLTQTVRERGGHYLLAIKGNQSKLAAEARTALDKAAINPRTPIAETHDDDHDRDEVRRCFVIPFRQSPGKNALLDLVAVARVERWRTVGAKTTHEVCAYALSRRMTAAEVLRALDVAGRHADLVAVLTDATGDGWANIVARGATFTWEVWNPSDANGDSMSHGWGSNVLVEIERALLGVRPTGPGFATFAVTPPTGGLGRAAGTVPTPRGTVSVSWVRNPGGGPFQLDVEVPPNSVAEVTVPAGRPQDVTEGGRPVDRATGVRRIGVADGAVRIEIGSGSYRFESRTAT